MTYKPREFVAIDPNGIVKDGVDPVQWVREYDDHYVIFNGYHEYRVEKQEGWTYEVRDRPTAVTPDPENTPGD